MQLFNSVCAIRYNIPACNSFNRVSGDEEGFWKSSSAQPDIEHPCNKTVSQFQTVPIPCSHTPATQIISIRPVRDKNYKAIVNTQPQPVLLVKSHSQSKPPVVNVLTQPVLVQPALVNTQSKSIVVNIHSEHTPVKVPSQPAFLNSQREPASLNPLSLMSNLNPCQTESGSINYRSESLLRSESDEAYDLTVPHRVNLQDETAPRHKPASSINITDFDDA